MKKRQLCLLISVISLSSLTSLAGPREQAWKLHNRLAGVPPIKTATADPLRDMQMAIEQNRPEDAAAIALENPSFYNIVLKNWIKPWTNREQNSRVDLNDYVATVIGMIRDEVPFNQILSADILYTVQGSPTAYSNADNNHYKDAEAGNINLMTALTKQTQSAMQMGMTNALPEAAIAGVITTRASGEAFFSAGTNRRVNRYNFMNYLCRDYEAVSDVNVPDYRVRRDVERNPGGDSRTYKSQCVGCHAGQDAIGGAYAYYDFVEGRLVYTPNIVVTKMNQNVYYKDGFQTTDDSWINTWASGQNASLGWRGATQGRGVKALGEMFTRSKAFSQCMAKKVFMLVCLKEPINPGDVTMVNSLADKFEQNNYNMKDLIINTSVGCIANEDA